MNKIRQRLDPKKLESVKELLFRFQAMPTERYFNEVFSSGLELIKNNGLDLSSGQLKNKQLFLPSEDLSYALGISYETHTKADNDFMNISYLSKPEEILFSMERRRGHLTQRREAKLDPLTRLLKGINILDIFQGLGEFQPYRVKILSTLNQGAIEKTYE